MMKNTMSFHRGTVVWLLCLFCILFGTAGCQKLMEQSEYWQWHGLAEEHVKDLDDRIKRTTEETEDAEAKRKGMTEHKLALEAENAHLKKEKESLRRMVERKRQVARDAYARVSAQINEQQNLFFDIRIGEAADKMDSSYPEPGANSRGNLFTVLVDMENPVEKDGYIKSLELYSSRGPFTGENGRDAVWCVVFHKLSSNAFTLKAISSALFITQKGKNYCEFWGNPLRVVKGDVVGVLLSPEASIDCDPKTLRGYGNIDEKTFAGLKIEDVLEQLRGQSVSFSKDGDRKGGNKSNRRFAFVALGMSSNKYTFLIDRQNSTNKYYSKALSSIQIAFGFAKEAEEVEWDSRQEQFDLLDIQMPFYVALFELDSVNARYKMVAISDRKVITQRCKKDTVYEKYNFTLHYLNPKYAGIMNANTICALVFPPGTGAEKLCFNKQKAYTVFEDESFNPIDIFNRNPDVNPFVFYTSVNKEDQRDLSYDISGDTDKAKINIDFRVNWEADKDKYTFLINKEPPAPECLGMPLNSIQIAYDFAKEAQEEVASGNRQEQFEKLYSQMPFCVALFELDSVNERYKITAISRQMVIVDKCKAGKVYQQYECKLRFLDPNNSGIITENTRCALVLPPGKGAEKLCVQKSAFSIFERESFDPDDILKYNPSFVPVDFSTKEGFDKQRDLSNDKDKINIDFRIKRPGE